DAALDELRAPLANGARVELQPRCDRTIGFTVGTSQNDLGPAAKRRWQRTTSRKAQQLRPLVLAHRQHRLRSASGHRDISREEHTAGHAIFMLVPNGTAHLTHLHIASYSST